MALPQHLTHKPIVETTNYQVKDKAFYKYDTDAVNLSIGFATFNKTTKEISAKVWRQNKNSKFNRQSEELPLHRALDLAILVIDNLKSKPIKGGGNIEDSDNLKHIKKFYDDNKAQMDTRIDELLTVINNFKSI